MRDLTARSRRNRQNYRRSDGCHRGRSYLPGRRRHVLLEGVPGLGKTTLLRTLSRVLDLRYSRIQFTPDLMPGDIVGSMVMENDEHGHKTLRFQPGPIFANLVLADEINRATPKTQSALLEAMQERTVTSGTITYTLERRFS